MIPSRHFNPPIIGIITKDPPPDRSYKKNDIVSVLSWNPADDLFDCWLDDTPEQDIAKYPILHVLYQEEYDWIPADAVEIIYEA